MPNLRAMKPFTYLFKEESSDVTFVILGPDQEHVGDWSVCDPVLRAIQDVLAALELGAGLHPVD